MSASIRSDMPAKPSSLSFIVANYERILTFLSPAALLLIWQVSASAGLMDTRFFPPPSQIIARLVAMLGSGELIHHISASLTRVFWGFVIGGIPALVLGLAMGLNKVVRAVLEPLVAAIYPIPKSAILPLALLIFGLGESSKIFVVSLGVFFRSLSTRPSACGRSKKYILMWDGITVPAAYKP